MTFREILQGITRHRANPVRLNKSSGEAVDLDLVRKFDEIEWALQAMAEKLAEHEESNNGNN